MLKTNEPAMKKEATREQVIQYIWARYIDNARPRVEIDETAALKMFEDHYSKHPINEDDECFYYGILLYERAFSDPVNRARLLVKAREVFEVYRNVSGETEWDVIEDRYADTCEIIEREALAGQVKPAEEVAPVVPGMVLVPSGPFLLGPDKKPSHLGAFYIDVVPVSNAQYKLFLEETKYRAPVLWEKRADLAVDDLPVTGVSWMDAVQFCKWAKKSLPTAEQWERAARGPNGLTYPWGEDPPTREHVNAGLTDATGEGLLRPVSDFPRNVSPHGALGMSGLVWEWTNTSYPAEEGAQVIKGGCYADPPELEWLATYSINWANKKEKNELIGFRCTRTVENA